MQYDCMHYAAVSRPCICRSAIRTHLYRTLVVDDYRIFVQPDAQSTLRSIRDRKESRFNRVFYGEGKQKRWLMEKLNRRR